MQHCVPTARQQLQDLVNSFVAYCDRHGLTVNPSKCEVVVYAKSCRAWTGFGDWKVKGKALPRSRKFKYLNPLFCYLKFSKPPFTRANRPLSAPLEQSL
jgi:hypothetical protein